MQNEETCKYFDKLSFSGEVEGAMNTDKKAVQVRFYITAEEQEALKRIKSRLGQSEAWILSTVTGSGLRAVDASGGSLPLPLKLGIQSETETKMAKR